ncbi:type II secretion system protein GspK [Rariglobus hedericola]|nr:type II secretion system protein GspK [Rariglobus hedericola]
MPSSFRSRGSVLLIVLVTLVFATSALLLFIEKATTDLLVPIREADASRLRLEAYSALETTLAVLEDFREAGDGLHSPAEGWGDPLGFAGYEPTEGRTVEVTMEDESAKLPLPSVKAEVLVALLKYWQVPQTDAERIADSLLGWIKKDYTPTAIGAPTTQDYEATALPFAPPGRSLRSWAELSAIEGVRQALFDETTGLPNALYQRLTETFSLYRYNSPNINGNRLEPLLAQEIIVDHQQQRVAEYLAGTGNYLSMGPGFFKNTRSIGAVAGVQAARLGYGVTVQALRITVTVRQGLSSFRLSVVVAPAQGAKVVPASNTATNDTEAAAGSETSSGAVATRQASTTATTNTTSSSTPTTAVPEVVDLKYPFTFLEIRENDKRVPPPAPSDEPTA